MKLKHNRKGFSLVEVVIALAIVAVTLPLILGVFARLSSSTDRVRDLHDVETVLAAVQNYMETDSGATDQFAEVYKWVVDGRSNQGSNPDDPEPGKVLYVYRPVSSGDSDVGELTPLTVSESIPDADEVNIIDARLIAVEVHGPQETVLPAQSVVNGDTIDNLPTDVAAYPKAYLPMQLDLFVATPGLNTQKLVRPFESLPFVLKR